MGDVVKGDERAPKPKGISKDVVAAMQEYLGGYADQILGLYGEGAQADLATRKGVAPGLQGLAYNLYSQYAPKYGDVQNQMQSAADLAGAKSQLANIKGPGGQAVKRAGKLQQKIDPEYFQNRAAVGRNLQQLLNSSMTPGEIEAIARGQNRLNVAAGLDVPNNTATVASALQFGDAARQRQMGNIALAGQTLPTLQTGDLNSIFGMASGRDRAANPNLQTGDTTVSDMGYDLSQNFANALFGGKLKGMDINAGRRTVYDAVNQSWTAAGSGTGGFASAIGCWVMLEAYNGNLPWHIDEWRRDFFLKNPQILKGYRRFARIIVPLMRRFSIVKKFIQKFFAFPVSDYIARKENKKIFNLWIKFFKVLGV